MALRAVSVLAAIALAHGAASAAADQRAPERIGQTVQPAAKPSSTIIASASPQAAPAPVKRKPAPRVTSCRCGGEQQIASAESAPQR